MKLTRASAARAITAWCERNELAPIKPLRHVHRLAYVVGHAAPLCLVVALPWPDSEPQTAYFDRRHPLKMVHKFDKSLKAGDWCSVAYVTYGGGSGQFVAAAIPEV